MTSEVIAGAPSPLHRIEPMESRERQRPEHARRFGAGLSEWRARRRESQLSLALDANVSQRHLSYIESGRAQPSQTMVVRLCEALDVPLRARNELLVLAGYAPLYPKGRRGVRKCRGFARRSSASWRIMSRIRRSSSIANGGSS